MYLFWKYIKYYINISTFYVSDEKAHFALETFLNSFIAKKYDDGHNKASDIEIRHGQTQVSAQGNFI